MQSLFKSKMFQVFTALFLMMCLGFQYTPAVALEPVPFSIVVNATGDDPDFASGEPCETAPGNGMCTLRAAIQTANAAQSIHGTLITFNITKSNSFAPTILEINAVLPRLEVAATVLEGPNKYDSSELVLNGKGGAYSGIEIRAANCAVKNLYIANFKGYGIVVGSAATPVLGALITGNVIGDMVPLSMLDLSNNGGIRLISVSSAVIGGDTAAERNIIAGNDGTGILIENGGTNVVKGNYIGLKSNGSTALPNTYIIHVKGSTGNTIGGNIPGERNVISGNASVGVFIEGSSNMVTGNYVGTNAAGSAAVPNGDVGVRVGNSGTKYSDNQIGGTNPGEGNLISGNTEAGIALVNIDTVTVRGNIIGLDITQSGALPNRWGITVGASLNNYIGGGFANAGNVIAGNERQGIFVGEDSLNTSIKGNLIGVNSTGAAFPNGLDGVKVQYAMETSFGGLETTAQNIIAYNGESGIELESAYAFVYGNAIFNNNGLGIDVWRTSGQQGVSLNDLPDSDNIQNFPVIDRVSFGAGGTVQLQGQLTTLPYEQLQISFYGSDACDPSGYGEGQVYLGKTDRTASDSGLITFNVTLPLSRPLMYFTTSGWGWSQSQSEFSACASAGFYLPLVIR